MFKSKYSKLIGFISGLCGFFGSALFGLLVPEGFSFLRPFLLCYLFDSHRVLYLLIRPLRWGHFCRLIQKYPKNRFFIRRIWKPNFPFAGEKGKYRLPMRLKLGSSSLTFKSEKIRLNSKLSVKIVRKQVYERTEVSFACCGF